MSKKSGSQESRCGLWNTGNRVGQDINARHRELPFKIGGHLKLSKEKNIQASSRLEDLQAHKRCAFPLLVPIPLEGTWVCT